MIPRWSLHGRFAVFAVAMLAAFSLLASCDRAAAFRAGQAVVRPAGEVEWRKASGILRPMVATTGFGATVDFPGASESTLEVAVAVAPGAGGDDTRPSSCRATFQARGSASPVTIRLDPDAGGAWSEGRAVVPAAAQGASLSMACDPPEGVVWARPLLLPASARQPPLIVLLSLDTLRADHVTGFGTPSTPTPALARLVREGVAFSSAVTPSTWTLPAHFSLFHSRLYGFPLPAGQAPARGLAATLSAAGFATAAFTGGGFVGSDFRFHEGFDLYSEFDGSKAETSDIERLPATLAQAGRWIDDHAQAPSFVFVHTYAVHEPPPSEIASTAGLPFGAEFAPTPAEVATARAYYGDLVGRLDRALEPFLEKLRAGSTTRPTLVVVLSDHGEAFGEHDNFRHGMGGARVTLHDEVIRVPMVFWSPGVLAPGRSHANPFSLIDVAPTVLSAAGLVAPATMIGRDFWPLMAGGLARFVARDRSRWEQPVLSYKGKGWRVPEAWAFRSSSRKSIVRRPGDPRLDDVEEYDLAIDPAERRNLALDDAAVALEAATSGLRPLLAGAGVAPAPAGKVLPECPACNWGAIGSFLDLALGRRDEADGEEGGAPRLDPETRRRLEALGYLN